MIFDDEKRNKSIILNMLSKEGLTRVFRCLNNNGLLVRDYSDTIKDAI